MSKVDAQRAMRESRFAERAAARAVQPEPQRSPATAEDPTTCGHRSIGGKSCRRPAGHSEKNHRYS